MCRASADSSSVIVSYSARKLRSIAISNAVAASTRVSSRSKMMALSPVRQGALGAMRAKSVGALGTQILRGRVEACEGGLLAKDLHGFKQRRGDPAPRDGDAQRPVSEPRLDPHLLHEHAPEGVLQRVSGEVLQVT